jgi:hypothetical protein
MNGRSWEEAMAYQLGWVLYLSCLALALGWALFFGFVVAVESEAGLVAAIRKDPTMIAVVGIPALVLYGVGRALRYVLSNE